MLTAHLFSATFPSFPTHTQFAIFYRRKAQGSQFVHQEAIELAMSIFRTSIDEENEAFIQLKHYHKRIDGSFVWASLATMAHSRETWRLLRRCGSEITEIGVFLTKLPLSKKFTETEEVETTMKENGKPVEMRFFFSKNSQKNTWDSKVVVDATPVSYGVRFQVFFWLQ